MPGATPNVAPGYFLEATTVKFTFDANVKTYAVSTGTIPPSISEYIAYDTLTPPNPFIAVTQDGKGRVVYDGGFPKFYNGIAGNQNTTFSTLTPSGKYLHNAITWVANPNKPTVKKVLILGDELSAASNYSVKSTGNTGFLLTMQSICAAAGFTPTFKNAGDYGSALNPTLSELENYSLVIFFGVDHIDVSRITPQAINDLVTFRENGNGLIMITDHGVNISSTTQAVTDGQSSGFFHNVNKLAARFGVYFTGNFDRTPVNVGFLRSTYGDHPLYANLTDTESIVAGASESKVVVTTSQQYSGSTPLSVTLTQGINNINILSVQNDGSLVSQKFTYILQGEEIIKVSGPNKSNAIVTNSALAVKPSGVLDPFLTLEIVAGELGTIFGEIACNGKRIGDFMSSGSTTSSQIYAGSAFKFYNGDKITFTTKSPIVYSKEILIEGLVFAQTPPGLFWETKEVLTKTGSSDLVSAATLVASSPDLGGVFPVEGYLVNSVRRSATRNITHAGTVTGYVYATLAALNTAVAAQSIKYNKCYIDASTGNVYAYSNGAVVQIPETVMDIYPTPITINTGGVLWDVSVDGQIKRR